VPADQQTYTITLAQYTGSSWGPVYLPDLQLDFTMLDPHIRTSLKQVSSSSSGTTYSASFKAPDRHGVFKFVVEYWRPGYVVLLPVDIVADVQMDIYPIIDQGICCASTT
jgi:oligosaccharyltransferase complex subunit beta